MCASIKESVCAAAACWPNSASHLVILQVRDSFFLHLVQLRRRPYFLSILLFFRLRCGLSTWIHRAPTYVATTAWEADIGHVVIHRSRQARLFANCPALNAVRFDLSEDEDMFGLVPVPQYWAWVRKVTGYQC